MSACHRLRVKQDFVFWELRRRLQSDDQVHGKMIKGLMQLPLQSIKLDCLP